MAQVLGPQRVSHVWILAVYHNCDEKVWAKVLKDFITKKLFKIGQKNSRSIFSTFKKVAIIMKWNFYYVEIITCLSLQKSKNFSSKTKFPPFIASQKQNELTLLLLSFEITTLKSHRLQALTMRSHAVIGSLRSRALFQLLSVIRNNMSLLASISGKCNCRGTTEWYF